MLPNPFEELSQDERRLAITQIAKNGEDAYQEALSELRAILRQHDPLLVLSQMSYYGLTTPVYEGNGVTNVDSDSVIFPFHVELLQAFTLQMTSSELSSEPVNPHVLQRVWEQIQALCDAHRFRRLDASQVGLSEDQQTVAFAQELIRGATEAVRNWGYHSQVKRIARGLYSAFDAQLTDARGFSASDVLRVFEAILTVAETRQTAHRETILTVMKSAGTDKRRLVEVYYEAIGLGREEAEEFVQFIDPEQTPLETLRAMLLGHFDLRLPDAFTFRSSDLAVSTPRATRSPPSSTSTRLQWGH